MNVLSLFDGMSCGQLALQRADIDVDRKVLADIAMNDPESFKQIVKSIS